MQATESGLGVLPHFLDNALNALRENTEAVIRNTQALRRYTAVLAEASRPVRTAAARRRGVPG